MEAWVKGQKFDPSVEKQIIDAVPNTKKVASDVVLALDAETGKEVWKFEAPGFPSGRGSSSTPAFSDGKVYAAMSEGVLLHRRTNGQGNLEGGNRETWAGFFSSGCGRKSVSSAQ